MIRAGLKTFIERYTFPSGSPGAYGFAVGVFLVFFLLKTLLLPPETATFTLFSFAAAVSAIAGGFGPGLLTATLCMAAAWYFLIPPLHSFRPGEPAAVISVGIYVLLASLECLLIDILRTSIFQLKEAAAKLGASEGRMRLIADAMPMLISYVDREQRYRFANKAYQDWFGLPPERVEGMAVRGLLGEAGYGALQPCIEKALAGERASGETLLPMPAGPPRHVSYEYIPRRAADGRIEGFYALVADISERKRTEEAIRLSAERLQMAHAAARCGAWDFDLANGTQYWSPMMRTLFGVGPDEVITVERALALVHPADRERIRRRARLALSRRGAWNEEFRILHPERGERWVAGMGRTELDDAGRPARMSGLVLDITERRQAEAALRARTAELEAIMETVPAIVWVAHDPEAKQITGSRYAAERLRLPPGANQSKTAPEAERPQHFRVLKDGVELPPERLPVQRAARGEEVRGEELEIVFDDGSRFHEIVNAAPLRAPDGRIAGAVGAALDISERKRAEERQRLLMAELDHRVRNILASIQSMVLLTGQTAPSKEAYAEALYGRVAAMARAHGLLTQRQWQGAGLRQIVEEALQPYAGGGAVLVEGSPECALRPREALALALVLHELATNAAKHGALSAAGGSVTVRWTIAGEGEAARLVIDWRESGGPPVAAPRRRGFGSQLIENALKQGGAEVRLSLEPAGARCRIAIPLDRIAGAGGPPAAAAGAAPAAAAADMLPAGLRLLLVEDEPLVALGMQAVLEDAGFEVVGPVRSLSEALVAAEREAFAAALLDVNLNGEMVFPVADRLRARGLPFLLLTGYDAEALLPERLRQAPALRKPVEPTTLVETLRRLLAAERRRTAEPAA